MQIAVLWAPGDRSYQYSLYAQPIDGHDGVEMGAHEGPTVAEAPGAGDRGAGPDDAFVIEEEEDEGVRVTHDRAALVAGGARSAGAAQGAAAPASGTTAV